MRSIWNSTVDYRANRIYAFAFRVLHTSARSGHRDLTQELLKAARSLATICHTLAHQRALMAVLDTRSSNSRRLGGPSLSDEKGGKISQAASLDS